MLVSLPGVLGGAEVAGLAKGEAPPSLYELTARSDLVVLARVISGALKLAQVQVREIFRGSVPPGARLQIAFRDFNTNLGKENRIVFDDGESELLFLVPEVDAEGKRKGKDRYTLFRGRFGRFQLPREGGDVYLDAVREFAGLAALKDHRELFRRLKALLLSPNPVLVDAGLQEVLKLDLVDREMVPQILRFSQDVAPGRRIAAMRLASRLFTGLRNKTEESELQDALLPPLVVLARNDPDEQVRVESVLALGAWGGEAVQETLREIADQDPAQTVRYQARVILLKASGGTRPSPKPDRCPER
jgi:HEAT repeat protein